MNPSEPFDYLAALEELRQNELEQKNQIHSPDDIRPLADKPVDYLAVSRAWEKMQAGKYTIYTTEQEDEGRL